jgi:hypothetical protein
MSEEPGTVLDLIRNHFGDDVGPDLITTLAGRLPPEFRRFEDEYRVWTRESPRVPSRPPSHLRPFITGSYDRNRRVPLYDLVFRGDESTIFHAVDAIKHQLLYCHSVALENPLQHLLFGEQGLPSIALANIRGGNLGFRVNGGALFRRYLILLSHLRPLIDSGALILVEAHWGVIRRPIKLPLADVQSLIGDLNVDTNGYFPGDPEDEETRQRAKASMVGSCLEYLRFVSAVRERSANAVDLFIEEPTERIVFKHIQQRCAMLAPVETREYEMRLLDHLLRLRLPHLDELSEANIHAIREEGAFTEWRHALTLALDRFDRDSLSAPPRQHSDQQLMAQIMLALEPHVAKLDHEMRRSSFLSKLRRGALEIVVGLGIDAVLGTMGAVTVASLTKQGLISTYKAYRDSQRNEATALKSHYVLFEEIQSAEPAI